MTLLDWRCWINVVTLGQQQQQQQQHGSHWQKDEREAEGKQSGDCSEGHRGSSKEVRSIVNAKDKDKRCTNSERCKGWRSTWKETCRKETTTDGIKETIDNQQTDKYNQQEEEEGCWQMIASTVVPKDATVDELCRWSFLCWFTCQSPFQLETIWKSSSSEGSVRRHKSNNNNNNINNNNNH